MPGRWLAFHAALICLLALGPVAGRAQSTPDAIVAQLSEHGYTEFEVSRTWLGRVRIFARGGAVEREIVYNPSTGRVLVDRWTNAEGRPGPPSLLGPRPGEIAESSAGADRPARPAGPPPGMAPPDGPPPNHAPPPDGPPPPDMPPAASDG